MFDQTPPSPPHAPRRAGARRRPARSRPASIDVRPLRPHVVRLRAASLPAAAPDDDGPEGWYAPILLDLETPRERYTPRRLPESPGSPPDPPSAADAPGL